MTDKFETFTDQARKSFALMQEEARGFNHNYIGTEHMLLGLMRQHESVAAQVLDGLGVQLPKVRNAVEAIIGKGDGLVVGDPGLTPRAKKVITLATEEARQLQSKSVSTEHLLLGLVREGEGIAAGILASSGVSLATVRASVLTMLGKPDTWPLSSPVAPNRSSGQAGTPTDITAGQFVYGLTLPPDMVAKLMVRSRESKRSLDDLIHEAIAKTWLQDAHDMPEQPTEA